MAKAFFGLLLVAALGFTGAASYKWYTGKCPLGLCHGDSDTASVGVKQGCCTHTTGSCCSESGNPEACTGECPATAEVKKDGECCPGGKCCPDGSCCQEKDKTEKKENKEETPK